MTIGAAVGGALPLLQAQAESMMTDTCTITRASGDPVFDGVTGTYTEPPPTTIYSGKCRIRTRSRGFLRDREAQAGDADKVMWPYIVAIPASVTADIAVLDLLTVDTSTTAALEGVELRVRTVGLATDSTARRIDCEEVAA